jgi:predicted metalloprotease
MYQRYLKDIGYDKTEEAPERPTCSAIRREACRRKRVNQKDHTLRLQEFFDHLLKGAPAPEWLEKSIPCLQREEDKGRVSGGR